MTEGLVRLVDEKGLALAAARGLVVCVLEGRFRSEMIGMVLDAQLSMTGELGARAAVLAVVRESTLRGGASAGPDDMDRARAALVALAPHVAALAVVLEGRGVVPTLARVFTAGGALLGRSSATYPSRVFAEPADAARWLAPHVPLDPKPAPDELLSALAKTCPR